jgi:hypothetical protein
MILPLPRTGPSRRCRLQLTTKIRLSSCSRDQPRVRVARQTSPASADLLAEVVEVVVGQAALEVCPGVDAGSGVTLEVHVVAAARSVPAAEEVVETDLVQRSRAGERRQVAADALGVLVGLDHHHRRVPADERPDATLDVLVAGEPRLVLARDRVDVGRADRGGEADLAGARPVEQLREQVTGPGFAVRVDDRIEGVEPLLRLARIDVRQLVHVAVEDHVASLRATPKALARPPRQARRQRSVMAS